MTSKTKILDALKAFNANVIDNYTDSETLDEIITAIQDHLTDRADRLDEIAVAAMQGSMALDYSDDITAKYAYNMATAMIAEAERRHAAKEG